MNIAAFVVGTLSEDPRTSGITTIKTKAKQTRAYLKMLGLATQSVLKNMQGVQEVRVLNVGCVDWHVMMASRFAFIERLAARGHAVILCDADALLVNKWDPPWESDKMHLWPLAECDPPLAFDHAYRYCFPAFFPPKQLGDLIWFRGYQAWHRGGHQAHDIEQYAYNVMFYSQNGELNEPEPLWDTHFAHFAATRGPGHAWLAMKERAEKEGLL
jgi:hypothetical protein